MRDWLRLTAKYLGRLKRPQTPHPNIIFRGLNGADELNASAWSKRQRRFEDGDVLLARIAEENDSYFVSKNDLVCPRHQCAILISGKMGYVDSGHWSFDGMKYYGELLLRKEQFKAAVPIN